MDEGELRKRLRVILTDDDLINKTIDEVSKDFFGAIHIEYGTDTKRTDIDSIKMLNALSKWLGEKPRK